MLNNNQNDINEKQDDFVSRGASYLRNFDVPDELIYNVDEILLHLIGNGRLAWLKENNGENKGHLSLSEVCDEKFILITTIATNAIGDTLSAKIILKEGLYQKENETSECMISYSSALWQTPETYIEFLNDIIIKHKDLVIAKLALPQDQKVILIHDYDYSHKNKYVNKFMEENNILPLYIPAGCASFMQVCNTVIKDLFLTKVKTSFNNYLKKQNDLQTYLTYPQKRYLLMPKTRLSREEFKTEIVGFILNALSELKTDFIKENIRVAFKKDSLLDAMKFKASMIDKHDKLDVNNNNIYAVDILNDELQIINDDLDFLNLINAENDNSNNESSFKEDPVPFEDHNFNIFYISSRVAVILNDEVELCQWVNAKCSRDDDDMYRRWMHAITILESGLQLLNHEEFGVCYCFNFCVHTEAHGITHLQLPSMNIALIKDVTFTTNNGNNRIVSNGWLCLNGLFELQFDLPSSFRMRNIIDSYREEFFNHPFYNVYSWENYRDLLDAIRIRESDYKSFLSDLLIDPNVYSILDGDSLPCLIYDSNGESEESAKKVFKLI